MQGSLALELLACVVLLVCWMLMSQFDVFPMARWGHGFGFMVWWHRVVVLLGFLLARFFAEPVLSPLWELAGLVVVVVVDETIMVLVSGGWLLRSHEGWAAFFLEGRRVDVAYF
jgi:hypothetical protein